MSHPQTSVDESLYAGYDVLYMILSMLQQNQKINIPHPDALETTLRSLHESGKEKLHVLADFDRTLTTAFVDGRPVPSILSVLRDHDYISPEYSKEAHALAALYSPKESDPSLSLAEKKNAMQEWWSRHFELLQRVGLRRKHIEQATNSWHVNLRPGAREFFDLLNRNNIPLVIMSASGLGVDSIELFLQHAQVPYDSTHIVSNTFVWDNDRMAGFVPPIIHSYSKDETLLSQFPFFDLVKDRPNVLLLGDSIGDTGMVDGFDYSALLKIGFLNSDIEKRLAEYQANFDLLLLNDAPMDPVNEVIKYIIE